MANVTLAEIVAQAESLSTDERNQLAERLRKEWEAAGRPRGSVLDFMGILPWDGQDIDEKIRRMRDED